MRCACLVQAMEALRRAKFKFAGRQKIIESRNWGFTSFSRDDYVEWKKEGRIVNCGVHAEVRAPMASGHLCHARSSAASAAASCRAMVIVLEGVHRARIAASLLRGRA
jgi:hypothetical protein